MSQQLASRTKLMVLTAACVAGAVFSGCSPRVETARGSQMENSQIWARNTGSRIEASLVARSPKNPSKIFFERNARFMFARWNPSKQDGAGWDAIPGCQDVVPKQDKVNLKSGANGAEGAQIQGYTATCEANEVLRAGNQVHVKITALTALGAPAPAAVISLAGLESSSQ